MLSWQSGSVILIQTSVTLLSSDPRLRQARGALICVQGKIVSLDLFRLPVIGPDKLT